ncbi:MAG: glycosyltransferase family 4 protein [Tannerellaceae bacterium]|nr:glycosyltransferase family 4 protein [Tannerellaceae bacterium]
MKKDLSVFFVMVIQESALNYYSIMQKNNKKIYIVTEESPANQYGIGQYLNQLIDTLKELNLPFSLITLYAQTSRIEIQYEQNYEHILIPFNNKQSYHFIFYYQRAIPYLLKDIIPETIEPIFHFQVFTSSQLIQNIKNFFNCHLLFTIHYRSWALELDGDLKYLEEILMKKENLKSLELRVIKSLEYEQRFLTQIDTVIFPAFHSFKLYHKNGVINKNQHCEVVSHGIKDTYKSLTIRQKKAIKKRYGIDNSTQIVLFAGRLIDSKGIGFLIEAFRKVVCYQRDAHLFIVGDGDKEDMTYWLKMAHPITTKISFLGKINREELYDLYAITNVGVVCSFYEEFGLVAAEMILHKVPVIVTETSGLAEIVENNIHGLTVPIIRDAQGKQIIDVNKMQKHIITLLRFPEKGKEFAENARKRFLEKYEHSIFKKRMKTIYCNI